MKRDILYVDDEVENLIVFEATFDELFNVVTATNAEDALRLLEERPFPVVVADQRMPGVSGGKLFEIMRQRYPQTKRVMLTGYSDTNSVLASINQGQVFYFIKKPWEQDVVYSVLVRAIEAYDLSSTNIALTERLVTADRCALLGRSAAQLAHEVGNQLCVLPLTELIEERYSQDSDLMELAAIARATHDRLVQIVNEVKSFVRFERENAAVATLSLPEVIREVQEFLRFEDSVTSSLLHFDVQAAPSVEANRVKVQQVLVNLVKNAAHAIRGRKDGRIEVSLAREGDEAVIRVADNGCGMSEDVAARIWEPFFTTKGDEGTGLGLDVAKSIVESHGGSITCQTEVGHGAAFTIRLPAVAPAAQLQQSKPIVASIATSYDAGSSSFSCR
jgi:signal transduction histidine kinase